MKIKCKWRKRKGGRNVKTRRKRSLKPQLSDQKNKLGKKIFQKVEKFALKTRQLHHVCVGVCAVRWHNSEEQLSSSQELELQGSGESRLYLCAPTTTIGEVVCVCWTRFREIVLIRGDDQDEDEILYQCLPRHGSVRSRKLRSVLC